MEACHLPPEPDYALKIIATKAGPGRLTEDQIRTLVYTEGMSQVVSAANNHLLQDMTTRHDPARPIRGILILDMDEVGQSRHQVAVQN